MPRVVSFIVLLAISLLIGSLFFRVMMQFVLPLFLAAILVVIFKPVHVYLLSRRPDWPRVMAVATTAAIFLSVVLPLSWLGWNAYRETVRVVDFVSSHGDEFTEGLVEMLNTEDDPSSINAPPEETEVEPPEERAEQGAAEDGETELSPDEGERAVEVAVDDFVTQPAVGLFQKFKVWYQNQTGQPLETERIVRQGVGYLTENGAAIVLGSVQAVFGLILGTVIAIVAVYYFLADGPMMIQALKHLSPLDDAYEQQLLDRFAQVSGAVVMATVLSAVAQGVLAGAAYFVVLPSGWPRVLLMALTMVFAVVPFVGCAAVWVPVCAALALFGNSTLEAGQLEIASAAPAAVGLALYSALIVGNADNVVKPLVLHGQSKLHPLLALLSVIGGIQAMGPIGILVGPMIVSFLQALLAMLNQELHLIGSDRRAQEMIQEAIGGGPDEPQPNPGVSEGVAEEQAETPEKPAPPAPETPPKSPQ
ncbi:MAG: AI-2E family transporter [Planctomycetota bacterium]